MKKILMATLLMAMTGVASAQVSLSGKVSTFADRTEVGATKSNSLVTEPTSNFAFSVNEKLANGLTARAVVETSLKGNTFGTDDTRLGDRQSTIGLASSFGSIDLGRNVHSHFLAITSNDVFGTLYGSIAGDVHNLRNLRMSDGVFVSLNPVKGVNLVGERTLTAVGDETSIYGVSGKLFGVNATATRFESGLEKSTVVGVGASLLGAKVHYTFSDNTGAVESKGHLVGAAKRFGNITAKGSWGKTNADVKAFNVGADYHLSKRTELTLAYRNVDRTVGDVTQVGVGVTHRF